LFHSALAAGGVQRVGAKPHWNTETRICVLSKDKNPEATVMETDRNELIRQRAYAIWEKDGRPQGKHEEHWQQASKETHGLEDAPKIVKKPAHVAPAGKKDRKR
jgi:hypothetical protein